VHIWRVSLEHAWGSRDRSWAATVGAGELRHAARLRHPIDRQRFLAAHIALRAVLGSYLRRPPQDVEFVRLPCHSCGLDHGKPALGAQSGGLTFNLSHSSAMALVAVGQDREVGVDVEVLTRSVAYELLAARVLPAEDSAMVRATGSGDRSRAFLAMWTRTEACLKATGEGLSGLLPSREPTDGVSKRRRAEDAPGWTVTNLNVGAGYLAAASWAGEGARLRCWDWS
jgi:4'-phosphopantetheinyl transferase